MRTIDDCWQHFESLYGTEEPNVDRDWLQNELWKMAAQPDEENGCEECWADMREEFPDNQAVQGAGFEPAFYPTKWIGKVCQHNPPGYAPSILLDAGIRYESVTKELLGELWEKAVFGEEET